MPILVRPSLTALCAVVTLMLTFALAARLRVVPLPGDPEAGLLGLFFASSLLAMPLAAHVARVSRAALQEVSRAQFLGVARAKGASHARVRLYGGTLSSVSDLRVLNGANAAAVRIAVA